MRLAVVLALLATPATAADWNQRDGDVVLSPEMMEALVVGSSHTFFDGGVSFFSVSGTYTYTYPDGARAYGTYEVRPEGVVCTDFRHGFSRCDQYVLSGDRLVLLTEGRDRFPVRERSR